MNMNKEIIKYKNMACKSIIIKKNNNKIIKEYKNNKISKYLLYMYNHFFCIYNYKIYKILSYKTLNNKKYNIYKKFNIYKNILI